MKKLFKLPLLLIMTSCSNVETYSLKEVAGFELSNIVNIVTSSSVYQSSVKQLSKEAYSYLNCRYIKVDFDIEKEFLSSWPPNELKDDAYILHLNIEDVDLYKDAPLNFYISHNTRYMYFDGIEGTYRSNSKMSSKFLLNL